MASLNQRCNFPWLLSNMFFLDGSSIASTKEYHIITRPGWKIGVIGLAEYGWVCTLNTLDIDSIVFEDFVECGERLARMLSKVKTKPLGTERGCNYIIALTHMRVPNDKRLCRSSTSIDMVLGGHDHVSKLMLIHRFFYPNKSKELCWSKADQTLMS